MLWGEKEGGLAFWEAMLVSASFEAGVQRELEPIKLQIVLWNWSSIQIFL